MLIPTEMVMHRHCPRDDAEFVPAHRVRELVVDFQKIHSRALAGGALGLEIDLWQSLWLKLMTDAIRELDCQWEGDVTVTIHSKNLASWTCPNCGEIHQFDFAAETADS